MLQNIDKMSKTKTSAHKYVVQTYLKIVVVWSKNGDRQTGY